MASAQDRQDALDIRGARRKIQGEGGDGGTALSGVRQRIARRKQGEARAFNSEAEVAARAKAKADATAATRTPDNKKRTQDIDDAIKRRQQERKRQTS